MNTSLSDPPTTNGGTPRPTEGELERQRAAIAALGHELRVLVDAAVRTTAPAEVLHGVADGVRRITGRLTGRPRARAEVPAVDEFPGEVRMYSPVTGAGSPLAPPMLVTPGDGGLVGLCTPGIAHEGPPGYVHGGMSAMLLDELMGRACGAAGLHAMTVSLQVHYHRPVPVETPLRVVARVTGTEDRRILVEGSISTDGQSATPLVTADGVFVSPDPDRARALFPGMRETP
ncbi:PaaI family thioesterase [Streptomyces ipomoeae]|uniref:PaaI family thioesterase n=1 Tax=Streptomyces ipomoeae TaxID=103232 RepID=UPI001146D00C|nr:PaaI family thioesterase [Streptomyces ipomoeae]MDX2939355.1 PaaI family thioesterase [Streptomyces ipomoeae]TQE25200.1 PaaI family thioesterase [Streptomyces ipomoeae]